MCQGKASFVVCQKQTGDLIIDGITSGFQDKVHEEQQKFRYVA